MTTTLQDVWDSLDPPLGGITGRLAVEKNAPPPPNITATIFMASQGRRCLDEHSHLIHDFNAIATPM